MNNEDEAALRFDITPMIDVSFLLIVFFMVTSSFSSLARAELSLPFADQASEAICDLGCNPSLCINIASSGQALVAGEAYSLGDDGPDRLRDFLEIEAEAAAREALPEGRIGPRPSKLRVLIRADGDVGFARVQGVLRACEKNGIDKIRLGARKESPRSR